MRTSIRKRLGAAVLAISLLVALVLYVSGTPMLTLLESHISSFPGGSATAAQFEMHWPLLVVCASALLGLVALVWPQRRPPRFQP